MQGLTDRIRPLIVGIAALAGAMAGCQAPTAVVPPAAPDYWPTDGWRSASPESQGMDSGALADAIATVEAQHLPIHSLLIVRHGYAVLDIYFYPFAPTDLHDLASVTKSVTATLVGIAIDQGAIGGVNQPVAGVFPEIAQTPDGGAKTAIAIRHLLSMSSGLDCGYESDERDIDAMRASSDWLRHTLALPAADSAGRRFAYCSPGMHLLSGIVGRTTGVGAREFAERRLFAPLGIHEFIWPSDPRGVTHGWGDLMLHPRDAAKLGYLYLHDGTWDGRQLVSREWVREATRAHIDVPGGDESYGYGWWIPAGTLRGAYEARGRGGQSITVWPAQDLVVVITGGGLDRGKLAKPLLTALKSGRALPENPAAQQRLRTAAAAVARAPAPVAVAPSPAVARRVSGRRYVLDANPLGIQDVRLGFGHGSEARLTLTRGDRRFTLPVGLDGVYRFSDSSPSELPVALKGSWNSDNEFVLDYNGVGGINRFSITLRFAADRMTARVIDEVGGYYSATIPGRLATTSQ